MLEKLAEFMDTWKGRLVRSAVAYGMGFAASQLKSNPWFIASAPLLQTFSKWLRDKYPSTVWELLPF